MVLIPAGTPGLTVDRALGVFGYDDAPHGHCEVTLCNVRVPLDNMLTTVMTTTVGLTVGCARCHDHKFDPIPQKDYYRLQAVFTGVRRSSRGFDRWRSAANTLGDRVGLR